MSDRYMTKVAVYLLLIEDNKVAALKRQNTGWMDGYYGLIAGHLEKDETLTQAMVREAKEEAGIDINPKDLKLALVQHRGDRNGVNEVPNEYLDFFFTVSAYTGTPTLMEKDKASELAWLDLVALPDNVVRNVRLALENFKTTNLMEVEW